MLKSNLSGIFGLQGRRYVSIVFFYCLLWKSKALNFGVRGRAPSDIITDIVCCVKRVFPR